MSQHLHGFMEEKIGYLSVGRRSVFPLISLIGPLCAVGAKCRGKWRISDDYADAFLDCLLLASLKETTCVNSMFL